MEFALYAAYHDKVRDTYEAIMSYGKYMVLVWRKFGPLDTFLQQTQCFGLARKD